MIGPTLTMHSPTDHGDLLSEISSLRLDNGGKDTGGKGTGMDPRNAREFKPSTSPYAPGDPPDRRCVINYLSSDCVSVGDLHWWTTDKHIQDTAALAGVKIDLKDIVFNEHKVNGKSKGSVTVNCRSPDKASLLMHWFHHNDFQGKKIQPTYVVNGAVPKPTAYNNPRPATNAPGAAPFATNAHGGINFNRLRPLNRQPMPQHIQHGHIGMGRPIKGLFHKIESGQLGIQDGMQYYDIPRHVGGGYPGPLQSHYASYTSVDFDHPSQSMHATSAGLPYGEGMSFR
ncbi:uncharacterized protein MKK02DRAFT_42506 [Dioszegia hungarica]|uniref:RRM domain-containing protein n=1 Tax=Dioszegia hungarica TaxID=4972 RepID=A0AA38HDC6_9TREE|nr:uncharacterized protein MKK02DRAFT_42506 [Dioszegia hungarica]KAI9638118.1 hypothetical protein MKK02DRAFT_42506 [Dioszegia hungarica]